MDAPVPIYGLKNTNIIGELLSTRQVEGRAFYLCRQLTPRLEHGEMYRFYSQERWKLLGNFPSEERGSIGADKHRERALPYHESHWRRTRAIVLARDDYACQECGATEKSSGKALQVHHIIPRQSCESNIEANDLNNLITLCYICHAQIECQDQSNARPDSPGWAGRCVDCAIGVVKVS